MEEHLNNCTWTLQILQFWISLSDDSTYFMVTEHTVSTINKYYVNYALTNIVSTINKHCVDYQQIWCQLTTKIVSTNNKDCVQEFTILYVTTFCHLPLFFPSDLSSATPLLYKLSPTHLPSLFFDLNLQATSTGLATYPV